MDKITLIKSEIERLKKYAEESKKEWINEGYTQNAFAEDCRISSFDGLLSFIDTLEEPDKSMEEEMDKFFETMPVLEHENIFEDTFKNIARHFAEWGAERQKKQDGQISQYYLPSWYRKGKDKIKKTLKMKEKKMNEVQHPGFDKPEEYETLTTTNGLGEAADKFANTQNKNFLNPEIVKNVFINGTKWGVEQFAKVVRANLSEIGKDAQYQFEKLYFEITGNKMYGGYKD